MKADISSCSNRAHEVERDTGASLLAASKQTLASKASLDNRETELLGDPFFINLGHFY